MATVDITERFQVRATPETVWAYLNDPGRVVQCLPGASLDEVIDENTFNGSMKVKVGPITTNYKGRVVMTERDEATRTVRMSAEGREGSGGSVRGGMTSRLAEVEPGVTEVTVESTAEITGRIAQFGRGLIQEVAAQLFKQFVECSSSRLEAEQAGVSAATGGASTPVAELEAPPAAPATGATASEVAPSPPANAAPRAPAAAAAEPKAVSVLPLVLKATVAKIVALVKAPFARRK